MDTDIVRSYYSRRGRVKSKNCRSAAIKEAIIDTISQIRSVLEVRTTPTQNVSAPAFVPSEPPTTVELELAVTNREHVSRLPKLHLQHSLELHLIGKVSGTPFV